MESVIRFLLRIEGWIYFICGSILILSIGKAIQQAKERRMAIFGLEQEVTKRRLRKYISLGIGSLVIIFAVLFLVSFSLVRYPGIRQVQIPTLMVAQTPSNISDFNFSPNEMNDVNENMESRCEPGKIEWVSPADGDIVQGTVELTGTVSVDKFAFYRYSYRKLNESEWTIIAVGSQQVIDGPLGSSWDTTAIEAGEYQMGLFVYDSSNSLLPVCVINITIPFQ